MEQDTLKDLIRKYSQFINFNIYLWSSATKTVEEPLDEEEEEEAPPKDEKKDDDDAAVEEEKEEQVFCIIHLEALSSKAWHESKWDQTTKGLGGCVLNISFVIQLASDLEGCRFECLRLTVPNETSGFLTLNKLTQNDEGSAEVGWAKNTKEKDLRLNK